MQIGCSYDACNTVRLHSPWHCDVTSFPDVIYLNAYIRGLLCKLPGGGLDMKSQEFLLTCPKYHHCN
jgi:hypothetical protein